MTNWQCKRIKGRSSDNFDHFNFTFKVTGSFIIGLGITDLGFRILL